MNQPTLYAQYFACEQQLHKRLLELRTQLRHCPSEDIPLLEQRLNLLTREITELRATLRILHHYYEGEDL